MPTLTNFGNPAEATIDLGTLARVAAAAMGTAGAAIRLVEGDAHAADQAPDGARAEPWVWGDADLLASFERSIEPAVAGFSPANLPAVKDAAGNGGFYAGIPLAGYAGALCVFDPEPRTTLSPQQWATLDRLAQICVDLLGARTRQRPPYGCEDSRALLDAIVAHVPAALSLKDAQTREYIVVNQAFERLAGLPASEIVGRTIRDLLPVDGDKYDRRDSGVVASEKPLTVEIACRRADGSTFQLRTKRILIDNPRSSNRYILGLTEDVTDFRRAEAAANFDMLTGLVNRTHFLDRMHRVAASGAPFVLFKMELHRLKSINAQFGVRIGDQTLIQTADRLRLVAGPADLVSRVAGNEFAMLLLGNGPAERALGVAEAIAESLAEPFLVEHRTIHSGVCTGISKFPGDAESVDELRRCADLALRRAKQLGRGAFCAFEIEMDDAALDRTIFESDLRDALRDGAFAIAYQPVLSVTTGQISSLEALARWTHPVRGPISPEIFIPLAEEYGLIRELGDYVLRRACTDALAWPESLRVAVNLSPLQFERGDLHDVVQRVLDSTGLAANRLQIEVTEGLLIRDVDRTFAQLEQLRALGIQILMDDFGVGYSSLSYFERFTFDKVKIDRSFIRGIGHSRAAMAIITSVIGLGQQLGMSVVAEGVETSEQAEFLTAAGCTHLQGYFFSRPLDAAAIAALLARGS